jgi:signal peptidase II
MGHRKHDLNPMMTRIGFGFVLFIAISTTIGCDRVTKHVAATTLSEAPSRSFLADTVRLEYVENAGAFLGLGGNWSPSVRTAIFVVGNGLLLLGLVGVAMRRRWPRRALLGVALCVAGGASNLADRITYGMVIDFMNVGIGPLRTGVFNVADMAIMLGAGMLALEGYRSEKRPLPQDPA